ISCVLLIVAVLSFLPLDSPFTLGCMAIAGAALLYQLWWILPYTPLFPREVKKAQCESPDNTFTLLTANVLTPNRKASQLLDMVRQYQPDILVTLESDQWWQDQLDTLEHYPYTLKCPLDNLYGMHVYSRL